MLKVSNGRLVLEQNLGPILAIRSILGEKRMERGLPLRQDRMPGWCEESNEGDLQHQEHLSSFDWPLNSLGSASASVQTLLDILPTIVS